MQDKRYKYVKFEDIKIGTKFRLVDRPEIDKKKVAGGFNPIMSKHFGDIVTINEKVIPLVSNYNYVRVEENSWTWDIRFLEPLNDRNKYTAKEMAQIMCDIYEIAYSDILNYKFKKVINNDNVIILFFENKNTGNIIKTVAKCDKEDTFDLEKGLKIAHIKMLRKIANKEYNKFIR